MARTYKKFPWEWNSVFRSPKGHCRSRRGKARKRSIPPDSYEDISFDKQCWRPMRIAARLADKGWDGYSIRDHLCHKLGLPMWVAREVAEMEMLGRPDDGCLRVFDERLSRWRMIRQ